MIGVAPGFVEVSGRGDVGGGEGVEVAIEDGDLVFGGLEGVMADGHGSDAGSEGGTVGAGLTVDEEREFGGLDGGDEILELLGRWEAMDGERDTYVIDAELL
jgi:hypothetical protein